MNQCNPVLGLLSRHFLIAFYNLFDGNQANF